MSAKSKPTTATSKPNLAVKWPNDTWEQSVSVIDQDAAEEDDTRDYWRKPGLLWSCEKISEESCCGFPVLAFFTSEDDKRVRQLTTEIGQAIADTMEKKKIKYMCTYIPNTKEYLTHKEIFHAAGFKPSISLKSLHGKYTNTRWDWFGPTYKEVKSEEVIPTPRIR